MAWTVIEERGAVYVFTDDNLMYQVGTGDEARARAAEMVKRWNAYPLLVEAARLQVRGCTFDEFLIVLRRISDDGALRDIGAIFPGERPAP